MNGVRRVCNLAMLAVTAQSGNADGEGCGCLRLGAYCRDSLTVRAHAACYCVRCMLLCSLHATE